MRPLLALCGLWGPIRTGWPRACTVDACFIACKDLGPFCSGCLTAPQSYQQSRTSYLHIAMGMT